MNLRFQSRFYPSIVKAMMSSSDTIESMMLRAENVLLKNKLASSESRVEELEYHLAQADSFIQYTSNKEKLDLEPGWLESITEALCERGLKAKTILSKVSTTYPSITKHDINRCLYTLQAKKLAKKCPYASGPPMWMKA